MLNYMIMLKKKLFLIKKKLKVLFKLLFQYISTADLKLFY